MEKTQIIFKLAGKEKTMTFSSRTVSDAFIKSASEKFGSKFTLVAAGLPAGHQWHEDKGSPENMHVHTCDCGATYSEEEGQEPHFEEGEPGYHNSASITLKPGDRIAWYLHQYRPDVREGVVTDVLPQNDDGLVIFDANTNNGQEVWGYMGLVFEINGQQVTPVNPDTAEFKVVSKKEASMKKQTKEVLKANKEKEARFNFFFPGQVLSQIEPELLGEMVDYPVDHTDTQGAPTPYMTDVNNTDALKSQLDGALDVGALSAVSTSPAGGLLGNDVKTDPINEDNKRGPAFMEEFYTNYGEAPALSVLAKKAAAGEEKQQFAMFLKRVMGEVAATFVATFKATSSMPLNKVPGVGEIQLAQVEQDTSNGFNTVNTASRVKYLLDKLADNEIQECINHAWAQAAVWCDDGEDGFVYEVFVRAETIDTDSTTLTYKFVTGTKEA